ncbi:MAG: cysteine hydrolase family protein [Eubacteriaceae bacterium]|jgi:nicotinamidase-related amidase
MKALILIDYTNDFVAEDGKLTTGKPGQEIDPALAQAIHEADSAGDFIVAVNDIHYPDDTRHPESALFPPHNIAGTPGRDIYGETGKAFGQVMKDHPERCFLLDKMRYSAFEGTPLDILLRQNGITEIELTGVCTDICILHSAVSAYNLNYRTTVRPDRVASFNPAGHAFALEHFKNSLGFNVPETGE